MNKNKKIFFLILLGCNLGSTAFGYGDNSGERNFSSGSGGNWLSGIIGAAVGVLGLSQSVNRRTDNSDRPSQYTEYNDSNMQALTLGRKEENCPSWNEREIRSTINNQRNLLYKTNVAYNNQRTVLTGKHKKRIKKRFEAIQTFFAGKDSLKTKSYNLSADARGLIHKHANITSFERCSGYGIQQVLHQEYVDIANALPKIQNAHEHARYVIPFTDAGVACNKAGYVAYACYFADFCWATVEGIGHGVYNTAQAFYHPINTATGISQGVLFLGKLLGAIGKEVLDITTLACFDEKQFKIQGEMRLRQAAVLADGIKDAARKNPREAYKNTVTFGTEWFLFGKFLSSFGKFADCVKPKLQHAVTALSRGTRPQYAFAGSFSNDIPLMEVLVDELGGLLHRAEEALGNAGNKIKDVGRTVRGKVKGSLASFTNKILSEKRFGARLASGYISLAEEAAELSKQFNNVRFFVGKTLTFCFEHIFDGEIYRDGNLGGFHHDWLGACQKVNPNLFRTVVELPNGFKKIEIFSNGRWFKKTLFPDNWDRAKVLEKILEAFDSCGGSYESLSNGYFRFDGTTDCGTGIRIIINNLAQVVSAYPRL